MNIYQELDSVGYMPNGEDWPYLIYDVCNILKPESVLDVGCGPCKSMMYFKNYGVKKVVGIDGSIKLLNHPQTQQFLNDIILVNLEKSPCILGRKFDLVWSYEVAEHIANENNFLATVVGNASKYIVITAALPHQGGIHHVNCKPQRYWINKIEEHGFEYAQDLVDRFSKGGWSKCGYMAMSGMVFRHKSLLRNTIDLKIGAYYQCYRDKYATYMALQSFRKYYIDAPVYLVSDGGDDFSNIAKYFNCDYDRKKRMGNGTTTRGNNITEWFNRLAETCNKYKDVDWIIILEDDVYTRGKIKHLPPAPLAGPCTMPFTDKAIAAIRKLHPHIKINGYSGCGGSIFHRETFLKCINNMYDPKWANQLDSRIHYDSDASLTFLFLYNGYENELWLDQSELSRGYGNPNAAFDHQYKKHYNKQWDDSFLIKMPRNIISKREQKMNFHLLGLAHLPTRWEYTSCAFTWKILRLAKMLKSHGHRVIFYGNENSEVECDEFVQTLSADIWAECYGNYDWKKEPNFRYDSDSKANQLFNKNTINEINKRKQERDILLCPMGLLHKPIADAVGIGLIVESGIGYEGIFAKYKVFESYAWMHFIYGKYNINDGNNYDCVIPNYYESENFTIAKSKPTQPYLLHISRMIPRKGIVTSIEVAKACKIKLVVAGQGDINNYLRPGDDHVEFVGVVEGEKKLKLISEATALIMPTVYIGPFEGVTAEAQLCGVPCLTTDWGAFTETIEDGKTGFRCRTLREFIVSFDKIMNGELSPEYIRERAVSLWDINNVYKKYEHYFYNLLNLYGDGWYTI